MASPVYKILMPAAWAAAQGARHVPPAPVDVRDGYIHLSAGHQVAETLRLHFPDVDEVTLLEIDGDALGEALRWEPSRAGAPFPHLYGDLPCSAVGRAWLIRRTDGVLSPPDFA